MRSLLLSVTCFVFLLAGCEASFSVSTAELSEPAMSAQVDPVTMAPIGPSDSFAPTTKTLNATIKLSNAPSDTSVRARFYLLGQQKQEISNIDTTSNGTGYLNFSLDPPGSGWPVGNYQVDFYLDEELQHSLTFTIRETDKEAADTAAAEQPATVAAARGERGYKRFRDEQFGFSMELPDDWTFRTIGENSNYLFSGADGNEEGEILLIVQMIDTRKASASLKNEMLNQLNEFKKVNGSEIVKKSEIEVSGTAAPFLLLTYPSANSDGETVTWGHTQLGLQNGPVILLISYAAPRDIYQRKLDIFQHVMDSMQLTPPAS